MRCDPSTLEIVRNHFSAICCGMGYVIERTSYSSYVTESADFAAGLINADGEFFAYPKTVGVTIFMGLSLKRAIAEVGGLGAFEPGDIVVTNDPYKTDGLSTHLPDIHIFKPVFAEGKLVCFAWTFVHTGDVGGSVPTSLTPTATDIQMEGLRIPPVKLYRAGELQSGVRDIILESSRMPTLLMGDLNSMISAVNTAEAKVLESVRKFGLQTVLDAEADLIEVSAERARAVVGEIPDGAYRFADYLDDDAVTDIPIRLAVEVRVEGGDITLDFSDSDPQTASAFNLITNGSHHPYIYQGLINYIITEDPFIPVNGGMTEPIHIIAPEGTVMNASYPAAGGLRHPVSMRLYNAVLGALARIIPQKLQAAGGGQACIVTLSVPDLSRGGVYRANVVEPMGGGGGGQAHADGVDGIDHASGFLRNTPIESLEKRTDILVRRYELAPDTAGAGEHRGGAAIELEFESLAPNSLVGARGQERLRFQPWGLEGGFAGQLGSVTLNPGTPDEQRLSKIKMLPVGPGDVIRFDSPSGGGWGDPRERDPRAVLADVESGLVTAEAALDQYGVVVRRASAKGTWEIDGDATSEARAAMPARERACDVGDARRAYERVWQPDASDRLAQLLQTIPTANRPHAKKSMHDALGHDGASVTAAAVEEAWGTQA